jgi:hypothetical protein
MKQIQESFNGVTTGSYTGNTISMSCRRREAKSISIKNTDSTNGLKFKIIGYFDKNSEMEKTLKSEETLAKGDIYNYNLVDTQYDHVDILIKEAVSATRATWLAHFNFR